MLPSLFYPGLAIMFVGLIASRVVSERAVRLLSAEEKLILIDSFPRLRAFGVIPMVAIAFLFFTLGNLPSYLIIPAYFGVWTLLATYIAWQSFYVHRRLRELNISEVYRRSFSRAQWCSRAGFLGLFVCGTISMFR